MDVKRIIHEFPKKRILVIGDVMLDEYVEGDADRISPEAPIAVLVQRSVRHVLGGAGNVAANVAALGGKASLIGIVGSDEHAKKLVQLCRARRIAARLITDAARPTTTKTRFVSGHHQLMRSDIENRAPISKGIEKRVIAAIRSLPPHDMVIVSDYAKGCMTRGILGALRARFGQKRIIADMKPVNSPLYKGIFAITPNQKETADMTGIDPESDTAALRAAKTLAARLSTSIVLTRGAQGVTVLDKKGRKGEHLPAHARGVRDVTGAGDTLIALLALFLANDMPLVPAAELANYGAGIVVGVAGTHALSQKELKEHLARTASASR